MRPVSTKRRAALERAEAEKQRRIDEKVGRGEAVRVPLTIVGFTSDQLDVEAARTRKLAELQKAGEKREIVFDPIEIIATGVPRRPESYRGNAADGRVVSEPERRLDAPRNASEPEKLGPESERRYVRIQIRSGNGVDDGGEIAEGEFTVQGNQLRLYLGRKTYSEWLRPTDDPEAVARRLLRTHCDRIGFNGPLRYWPRGIV
jgi:hypothetical protein